MLAEAGGATLFGIPLAFFTTAAIIEATPGPNMSYLAMLTLAEGRRAGLAAVAGVALGLLVVGLLAAFGVAALIGQSTMVYHALRWAGAAYLAWLALDIWRGENAADHDLDQQRSADTRRYFVRGFVTNLLNPKAAVFYVAMLPTFVDASRPIAAQTLTLSLVYVAVATLAHLLIVLGAARLTPALRNAAGLTRIRTVLAAVVLMTAVWLLWSTAQGRAPA